VSAALIGRLEKAYGTARQLIERGAPVLSVEVDEFNRHPRIWLEADPRMPDLRATPTVEVADGKTNRMMVGRLGGCRVQWRTS